MAKRALFFRGGWDGHEPVKVSERFAGLLKAHGFECDIYDNMDCLSDIGKMLTYDIIIPLWTMGEIDGQYSWNISEAVSVGVGLAGCHGGMCDAFRNDTRWQFMTGGQWVSHPGGDGINYTVNIHKGSSPIVEGLEDFPVCSEHYYMQYDPSVEVLASTRFPEVTYYHAANKAVDMPVAWTKFWGLGRVFYCSLGHHDDVFDKSPTAQTLMERGMLWAAGGKEYAKEHGLSPEKYQNNAKMY